MEKTEQILILDYVDLWKKHITKNEDRDLTTPEKIFLGMKLLSVSLENCVQDSDCIQNFDEEVFDRTKRYLGENFIYGTLKIPVFGKGKIEFKI